MRKIVRTVCTRHQQNPLHFQCWSHEIKLFHCCRRHTDARVCLRKIQRRRHATRIIECLTKRTLCSFRHCLLGVEKHEKKQKFYLHLQFDFAKLCGKLLCLYSTLIFFFSFSFCILPGRNFIHFVVLWLTHFACQNARIREGANFATIRKKIAFA